MKHEDLKLLKVALQELLKIQMPQSVKEQLLISIDVLSDEMNFLLMPKEKQS